MILTYNDIHIVDDIKNLIENRKVPKLYKFISFDTNEELNSRKIDGIRNSKLYMASPLRFNDPYDCELSFNFLDGYEDFLKIGLNRKQRRIISHNKKLKKETKQDTEKLQNELQNNWNELRKQMAVCCFIENINNFLMWSHYANCYNGICLEYNYNEIYDKKYFLSPVIYTDSLVRARDFITKEDLSNNNYCRFLKAAIVSVLSKQLQWSYESEWRIITLLEDKDSRDILMPKPKSIFIGFKVNEDLRERLKNIANILDINAIFEMKISTNEYKLTSFPIR